MPRQNVVLFVVDDARTDDMSAMPRTRRLIGGRGTTFTHAYVTTPICCPSRSSILTGDYAHTTGVWTDHGEHGGRPAFQRGGGEASNVATWLHAAGYRTALIGKYLNVNVERRVPPGWDEYFAFFHVNGGYYDYPIDHNGRVVRYGHDPGDYSTEVLRRQALSFIRETPAGQPLFLYFATFAPHAVPQPAPGDENAFEHLRWNTPPSFNEADVSDKPAYIRDQPLQPRSVLARLRTARLRSLLAVDRAVEDVVTALRRDGRLSNTLLLFISDNGFSLGEHRWRYKAAPYEEDIRVPLLLRDDALGELPRRSSGFALNIDLAPTIAEVARVEPPNPIDGRSLIPLLRDPAGPWRSGFTIEDGSDPQLKIKLPSFCGYHTQRYVYVVYSTGERELYDLREDPYQLVNRAGDPAYASIEQRLLTMDRRSCSPPPPDFGDAFARPSPSPSP
jgi:N-acetylglucosamine-6-sulfatase